MSTDCAKTQKKKKKELTAGYKLKIQLQFDPLVFTFFNLEIVSTLASHHLYANRVALVMFTVGPTMAASSLSSHSGCLGKQCNSFPFKWKVPLKKKKTTEGTITEYLAESSIEACRGV